MRASFSTPCGKTDQIILIKLGEKLNFRENIIIIGPITLYFYLPLITEQHQVFLNEGCPTQRTIVLTPSDD